MNQDKKIKLFGFIMGLIAFIAVIAGITYAYLNWKSNNVVMNGSTGCFTINYTAGTAISGSLKLANLSLDSVTVGKTFSYDSVTMAKTTVQMGISSSCSIGGTGTITLNTTSISSDLLTGGSSAGALKYAVINSSNVVLSKGTVTATSGKSQDIYSSFSLSQGSNTSYTIVLWLDGNLATTANSTYGGYISASASQNQ